MKVIGRLLLLFLIVTMVSCLFQAVVVQIPPGDGLVPGIPNWLTVAVDFAVAIGIAGLLVWIWQRAARSAEQRSGWVGAVTGPNAKVGFFILLVGWAIFMGLLNLITFMPLLPPGLNGAPSAGLGGLAFVGLIVGAMLFFGFIWAVIGE